MKLATLDALGYTSALERLAERSTCARAAPADEQGLPRARPSIEVPNMEPFHPPMEEGRRSRSWRAPQQVTVSE